MTQAAPAHILIVEDDTTLNEAYRTILETNGYTVSSAQDGKVALERIEASEPDVIFLDLRMPVMDGVEFLKEFNQKHPDSKIKIIVFSNYDSQKEIDEVYRLGAYKYILKAWASPGELLKIVENTLASA